MIRNGGVFFVAAKTFTFVSSKESSTLELNPMTATEVEQAALARKHAAFGIPGPAAGATLDGDGEEPMVRIKVPTGKKKRCIKLQDMCLIETGVKGALRRERRTNHI